MQFEVSNIRKMHFGGSFSKSAINGSLLLLIVAKCENVAQKLAGRRLNVWIARNKRGNRFDDWLYISVKRDVNASGISQSHLPHRALQLSAQPNEHLMKYPYHA
jgi:hypothetical protein